jgi:hypothetical protein
MVLKTIEPKGSGGSNPSCSVCLDFGSQKAGYSANRWKIIEPRDWDLRVMISDQSEFNGLARPWAKCASMHTFHHPLIIDMMACFH